MQNAAPALYKYHLDTGEYLYPQPTQARPNGEWVLEALDATPTAPPTVPESHAAVWNGTRWELVEDHRQHLDDKGTKAGGTPYWLPGDHWQSPERYMTELGPLPAGALTAKPEKPAPTLEQAKKAKLAAIDAETSAAIVAGFFYVVDGVMLHFSYDSFDQQNFADSANMALLARGGTPGLPASVTWNAYRDWTPEAGGELARVNLDPEAFLTLYTAGALAHKAEQMELGGRRKATAEAAATLEALEAA